MASSIPLPLNEAERLASLRQYDILDTYAEDSFDEITRLVAQTCAAPMAAISFVDERRQWFKSRLGIELAETPREQSMGTYTILQNALFVVEDASQDDRFRASPLVQGPPAVRFFAGAPLVSRDGYNVGALCVLDRTPRQLTPLQADTLRILAHQVMMQLELRRNLLELARSVEVHKHTEEQLRNSEVFYHTLVESLPQHILRKNREGRFTFANRRFCDLLGKPLEEIVGKTDRDFFPRDLADKYHRDDLRVMLTRQNLDTIEAHVTPQGEKKYVHVIKTPLYDAQGQVVGIQGIFWDVTERKRVEEELAYERDLLRSLLENTPDRIFFKDTESCFIRCSASMAKRLGVAHARLVEGKTDFDFYARELAQEFYADEQKIILTKQPLINKLERRVTADGQENWSSVTKVPIYSQSGTVTGIVGLSRDVTALKQAEAALKHARDAALESARVKSQFLANISHEIRTPMHAITGMTDLLASTPLTPEQHDYVDTVRNSTQTLLGIINDILDYSKMEAGKLTIEPIDFDLHEAVEHTLSMLAEHAHRKGLELACWIDHSLPNFLHGDPGRFRQVLLNLTSNAVKFTERGEVFVRVTKRSETQDRVSLHVAVKDTGVGIPEEAIAKIFEAFTQADGTTTRRFGGTGLGLTISRQLIELMGGEIGAQSVLGQGSIFWFNVPFAKQTTPVGVSSCADAEKLADRRVLVADDSETLRGILHDHLHHWHMMHAAVASAAEAEARLREAAAAGHPFDLVLADLTLADTGGLELARRIHSDPSLRGPRVVLLSPLGRRPDDSALQAAGVSACLFKPLWQARLAQILASVLDSPAIQVSSLPVPTEAEGSALKPEAPPSAAASVRILLAEDNVVNQRVALKQLKKLGYHAETVSNGAEVLTAIRQRRYDVILMDCQMPELDGYEVTRRIRQAGHAAGQSNPTSPYIIALTAHAFQGDREKCLAVGMNDYLTKPIHLPRLNEALRRAVDAVGVLPFHEPYPLSPGEGEGARKAINNEDTSVPPGVSAPASGAPALSSGANDEAGSLDLTILESLRSLREPGQPDPLKELGELFLRDTRPRLAKIESAVEAKDAANLASAAHALKGSASNIGARRLAQLCAALEKLGKSGDLTESASILLTVKSEFHRVEVTLVAELQK